MSRVTPGTWYLFFGIFWYFDIFKLYLFNFTGMHTYLETTRTVFVVARSVSTLGTTNFFPDLVPARKSTLAPCAQGPLAFLRWLNTIQAGLPCTALLVDSRFSPFPLRCFGFAQGPYRRSNNYRKQNVSFSIWKATNRGFPQRKRTRRTWISHHLYPNFVPCKRCFLIVKSRPFSVTSPLLKILCIDKIGSRPRRILCVDKIASRPRGILVFAHFLLENR